MNRFYCTDSDTLSFVFRYGGSGEEIEHLDLGEQAALQVDSNGIAVGLDIYFATERGLRVPPIVQPGANFESNVQRRYIANTDTLVFEFHVRSEPAVDCFELDGEGTLLELDCDGNPVALTIERAKERGVLPQLAVEEVA